MIGLYSPSIFAEVVAMPGWQEAKVVHGGHRDNLERIRTGGFRAEGSVEEIAQNAKKPETSTYSTIAILGVFDFKSEVYRFDRTERSILEDGTVDESIARFVATPDGAMLQLPGSDTAVIYPWPPASDRTSANARALEAGIRRIQPFDIRCLGCMGESTLTGFARIDVISKVAKPDNFVASRTTGSIQKQSFVIDGAVKCDVWYDIGKGCCPIKYEERYRRHPVARGRSIDAPLYWSEPQYAAEVSWSKTNGVWLPITVELATHVGVRKPPYTATKSRRTSLAFVWESVNEDVSGSLFQPEGIDDPKLAIVDSRLGGRTIIVKHPKVSAEVLEEWNEFRPPTADESNFKAPNRRFGTWLLIGNLIAAAIVCAVVLLRRRLRKGSVQ
jgi:hypothetical protein